MMDEFDLAYGEGYEDGQKQMEKEYAHLESEVLRLEAEIRVLRQELKKEMEDVK